MDSFSSELESAECSGEGSRHSFLLRDIDEIGKALDLHVIKKKPLKSIQYYHENATLGLRTSNRIWDSMPKEKKSSLWNWKPLKALVHFGHHHLNCRFFLHVHGIEGLSPDFNNLNLCVTWKRKSEILRTRPVRVQSGMAEFEETLTHRSTISYGFSGSHQSLRYEQKIFLVRPLVIEAPSLDIGIQWIDLSRLLPLTLGELDKDDRKSGKWTTSFRLTGKAKSAVLNVSLGFSLAAGNSSDSHSVKNSRSIIKGGSNSFAKQTTQRPFDLDSVSSLSSTASLYPPRSLNMKLLDGTIRNKNSELSTSLSLLYQKLEEGRMQGLPDDDQYFEDMEGLKSMSLLSDDPLVQVFKDLEFDVIGKGVEVSMKGQLETEKTSNANLGVSSFEAIDVAEVFKEDKSLLDKNLELDTVLATNAHDPHPSKDVEQELTSTFFAFEETDSALYDALMQLDTRKYCEPKTEDSMFSCKPERLMRSNSLNDIAESIENDFLAMLNMGSNQDNLESGVSRDQPLDDLTHLKEYPASSRRSIKKTDTSSGSKKVKFVDDFDLTLSPVPVEKKSGDERPSLWSRLNAEALENMETEALMHKWGLKEEAFQYSPRISSGGFGSPVSVPDELPISLPPIEEGIGPIIRTRDGGFLRSLSPFLFRNVNNSARLLVQISAPVLLPSKTGCHSILELLQRWASGGVQRMCMQMDELMPLEDVTGKTMLQVLSEAESTHGAFTSSMYDAGDSYSEEINLDPESFEDLVPVSMVHIESLLVEGLKIQSGMATQEPPPITLPSEGVSTFHGLDDDEFIKCSLHMKQWITLNSGTKPELLESNFIMALKVQLRDPLRDYEMVGFPMLALIQAEKVHVSPIRTSDLLFKLSDAHVAGLNLSQGKKDLWGSTRQHQTGSRWLLSSGMAKPNKKNLHLKTLPPPNSKFH